MIKEPPEYYTPEEVAAKYRISLNTLATWRSRGTGFPYVKLEGKILYNRLALEKHIKINTKYSKVQNVD